MYDEALKRRDEEGGAVSVNVMENGFQSTNINI
jgi:hypothetical protein